MHERWGRVGPGEPSCNRFGNRMPRKSRVGDNTRVEQGSQNQSTTSHQYQATRTACVHDAFGSEEYRPHATLPLCPLTAPGPFYRSIYSYLGPAAVARWTLGWVEGLFDITPIGQPLRAAGGNQSFTLACVSRSLAHSSPFKPSGVESATMKCPPCFPRGCQVAEIIPGCLVRINPSKQFLARRIMLRYPPPQ